jgi:uncharacterized delta-60 repeat protein
MKSLLLEGLTAALLLAVSPFNFAIADPGDLDQGFGSGGKVITTFPGQLESLGGAYAVGLQADGKIVAAGWSFPSAPGSHGRFALARYNVDGSLDTSFGTGGKVRTGFGSANAIARALALQADGKIVAAGTPGFSLARYKTDGTLDGDFGVSGTISGNVGLGSDAFALSLQPDGKLVVAGYSVSSGSTTDFAVARYTIRGGLDDSFGRGGVATSDLLPFDQAFAVAVQPDGKILAAGRASADVNFGPSLFALARYNPDGSPDVSFGQVGKVTTAFGSGAFDRVSAMALQSDGKIVVAGITETNVYNGASAFTVARYNPDGSLDNAFGTAGKAITTFPKDSGIKSDAALSLAVQPDGRIVVGGHATSGLGEFALARYNPDGSPDVGFGNAGTVNTAFSASAGSIRVGNGFYGLALQPDGKIVAAGVFSGAFALARYEGRPAVEPPNPALSLRPNQASFTSGETLHLDLMFENSGGATNVDVYFGALLPAAAGPDFGCPRGDAIVFVADNFTKSTMTCLSAPQNLAPLAASLPIAAGIPQTVVEKFFSFVWPPNAPPGAYTFFLGLMYPGTLNLMGLAPTSVSFSP